MELKPELLRGVYAYGFERPSAIQQRAIMPIITGRDVIAQAQSGTGKTATFSISILQRVSNTFEAQLEDKGLGSMTPAFLFSDNCAEPPNPTVHCADQCLDRHHRQEDPGSHPRPHPRACSADPEGRHCPW